MNRTKLSTFTFSLFPILSLYSSQQPNTITVPVSWSNETLKVILHIILYFCPISKSYFFLCLLIPISSLYTLICSFCLNPTKESGLVIAFTTSTASNLNCNAPEFLRSLFPPPNKSFLKDHNTYSLSQPACCSLMNGSL